MVLFLRLNYLHCNWFTVNGKFFALCKEQILIKSFCKTKRMMYDILSDIATHQWRAEQTISQPWFEFVSGMPLIEFVANSQIRIWTNWLTKSCFGVWEFTSHTRGPQWHTQHWFYLNLPKCHCDLTFCAWDEDSALSGLKLTTSLHIYFSVLLLLALSFFSNCPPSFLPFYHSHLWSLLVCLLITPFPLISSLMPVSAVQGDLRLRQWNPEV